MNKSVLITGASGGIGEELCRQFAKAGYDITTTAAELQDFYLDHWQES